MPFLNIVPPANSVAALTTSTSGGAGSALQVSIVITRKGSGVFSLDATVPVNVTGAGPAGVTASLSRGAMPVGPLLTFYGAHPVVQFDWTDTTTATAGNGTTYTLLISPISGSNSLSIAANAGAVCVREL
jgi:hypothetical protein